MKRIRAVVLGQSGFIGKYLVTYLKDKNYEVPEEGTVDYRNYKDVIAAFSGADWVFNLSANMGGVGYFSRENYYPSLDNFQIDINVLRACEKAKIKRLFYPCSACAYPRYHMESGIPLREELLNDYADPDQMYGWEKLTILKLIKQSNLDIRVGILHTIYGEGQAYQGIKAKFPPKIAYKAVQAVKTGSIEVWGDGKQERTFLHISDAVEKIHELMAAPLYYGEVNIGSDKTVTVDEVVAVCIQILKIQPKVIHMMNKPSGVQKRRCDNTKWNTHYTYRDKISLKQGFKKIIQSYE